MERQASSSENFVDVEHDITRLWFAPTDDEHRALLKVTTAISNSKNKRSRRQRKKAAAEQAQLIGESGTSPTLDAVQSTSRRLQDKPPPPHQSDNDDEFDDAGSPIDNHPPGQLPNGYSTTTNGHGPALDHDPHSSRHFFNGERDDDALQEDDDGEVEMISEDDYLEEEGEQGDEGETKLPRDEEDEEAADQEVPNFMICPISYELMSSPVIASDGQTYDKLALSQWASKCKRAKHPVTSPLTQAELDMSEVKPNIALKEAIQTWQDETKKNLEKYKAKEEERNKRTEAQWEAKLNRVKVAAEERWGRKLDQVQSAKEAEVEKARARIKEMEDEITLLEEEADGIEEKKQERVLELRQALQQEYTRNWQRDSTATRCIHCAVTFKTFRRKHHCRNCGYIFCHSCCNILAQIGKPAAEKGTGGKAVPPSLERICVRCALSFSNQQATGASSSNAGGTLPILIVPPSYKNYFHLSETKHWSGAVGDGMQLVTEYLETNAPIAGKWIKDSTLTMVNKFCALWK